MAWIDKKIIVKSTNKEYINSTKEEFLSYNSIDNFKELNRDFFLGYSGKNIIPQYLNYDLSVKKNLNGISFKPYAVKRGLIERIYNFSGSFGNQQSVTLDVKTDLICGLFLYIGGYRISDNIIRDNMIIYLDIQINDYPIKLQYKYTDVDSYGDFYITLINCLTVNENEYITLKIINISTNYPSKIISNNATIKAKLYLSEKQDLIEYRKPLKCNLIGTSTIK